MTSSRSGSGTQTRHHRHPWPAISTWPARAWRGMINRCLQALRNRRHVKPLSALDDHQLKDIGLARVHIESAVAMWSHQRLATPRPPQRSSLSGSPTTASAWTTRVARMNSIRHFIVVACLASVSACSTVMTTTQSGFLSSYSGLTLSIDGNSASTRSAVAIDPARVTVSDIEWRAAPGADVSQSAVRCWTS